MKFKLKNIVQHILLIGSLCSMAHAHVGINYPNGGETFQVGTYLDIQWYPSIDHGPCTWEIYFSADSGHTWNTIAVDIAKEIQNYNWLLPDSVLTYYGQIRVVQNNLSGQDYSAVSGPFSIALATRLDDPGTIITGDFSLYPAYPNPFNGATVISFRLEETTRVGITIHNQLGQKVAQLFNGSLSGGNHNISWNPKNLPSGVYIYSINTPTLLKSKRLVYIK